MPSSSAMSIRRAQGMSSVARMFNASLRCQIYQILGVECKQVTWLQFNTCYCECMCMLWYVYVYLHVVHVFVNKYKYIYIYMLEHFVIFYTASPKLPLQTIFFFETQGRSRTPSYTNCIKLHQIATTTQPWLSRHETWISPLDIIAVGICMIGSSCSLWFWFISESGHILMCDHPPHHITILPAQL